ncbi:MAG: hypothetical protein AABX96_03935 [Nanoarchaeota archaeon]
MRKLVLLLCALLVITLLLTIVAYSFTNNGNYFNYGSDNRTYTRAVCSGNTCRDYEFRCLNGRIISSRAISGFVTFSDDWVDNRDEKDIDRC